MASGITATSTFAEVKAIYVANSTYDEDNDLAKARAFVSACRALIGLMPRSSTHGVGSSLTLSPELLNDQIKAAQQFISLKTPAGRISYFKFPGGRE